MSDWTEGMFGGNIGDEAEAMLKARQLILRVSDEVVSEFESALREQVPDIDPDVWDAMETGARAAVGLMFARLQQIVDRVGDLA